MGELVQFVTPLHQATSRAYIDRMVDEKVHCMLKAKEYEVDLPWKNGVPNSAYQTSLAELLN